MTAAAVKTSEHSGTIGKKELCALLGWSRPTLDRRLNSDPNFPVRTRGGRGGGWSFDAATVQAYLAGDDDDEPHASEENEEGPDDPADLVDLDVEREARRAAPGRAIHRGEVTARQQKDQADADLKIDKLKRMRGELVDAKAMRDALETIMVEMRSGLLAMPDALAKEFGLTERLSFAMKGKIEGMMRASVQALQKKLAVTIPTTKPDGVD